MTKPLLTRKDIAQMLDVSVNQVWLNEERWGIRVARADLNKRCVRYRADVVLANFRARGFIPRQP